MRGDCSCVGGSIATHIRPPNMRGYMSVNRNKCAGIIGLEIDNLVVVARAHPQVAVERRIAADFGRHGEGTDVAATARDFEIETAQRFAVVTCTVPILMSRSRSVCSCFCLALPPYLRATI